MIATLHTPDAAQTIQRIYSVFPAEQQNAITVQLANSLQELIAQKLLPRANAQGRVLACEICIATHAVRNHIRERQMHQLYIEMQMGRRNQMQTMDQVLLELYQHGEITYDVAVTNAREPDFSESARSMSSASCRFGGIAGFFLFFSGFGSWSGAGTLIARRCACAGVSGTREIGLAVFMECLQFAARLLHLPHSSIVEHEPARVE